MGQFADFSNGLGQFGYGIDQGRRVEWEAMEEFPPYEPGVDIGKSLFEKYNVGKCFKNGGIGIRQNYPWFNSKTGEVHTLEGDIMRCLKKNGRLYLIEFSPPKIGKTLRNSPSYMKYRTRKQWIAIFEKHGLRLAAERPIFFIGFNLLIFLKRLISRSKDNTMELQKLKKSRFRGLITSLQRMVLFISGTIDTLLTNIPLFKKKAYTSLFVFIKS